MSEEIEKAAQEEQQVKIVEKQTEVPSLYVNNAQFTNTEWDIRIDVGELHSVDAETKTMFVVHRLRLIMNPGFAQRFVDVLAGTLARRKQAESQAQTLEPKSPA